jgi:hypothetical protein
MDLGRKWVDDDVEFNFPSGGGELRDGTLTPFTYPYEIEDIGKKTRTSRLGELECRWRRQV